MIPTQDPAFRCQSTPSTAIQLLLSSANNIEGKPQQQQQQDEEEDIDISVPFATNNQSHLFANNNNNSASSSATRKSRFYPLDTPLPWSAFSKLRRSWLSNNNNNNNMQHRCNKNATDKTTLVGNEQQQHDNEENNYHDEDDDDDDDDSAPTLVTSSDSLLTTSQLAEVTKVIAKIKAETDVQRKSFWLNMPLPAVSRGILDAYCPQLKKTSCSYHSGKQNENNNNNNNNNNNDPFSNLVSFLDQEYENITQNINDKNVDEAEKDKKDESNNNKSSENQEQQTPHDSHTYEGTTLQILAVLTGNTPLLQLCLESGLCNPNDQRFLMDLVGNATAELLRVAPRPQTEHNAHNKNPTTNGSGGADETNQKKETTTTNNNSSLPAPGQADDDERQLQQVKTPHLISIRNGYTPFFMACICEQLACMELLFHRGASMHVVDRWGRTPLHAAAALGNKAAVDWLLAHGAPRLVVDRDAFRPGALRSGCCVDSMHIDGDANGAKILIPPRDPRFSHILMRPYLSSSSSAPAQNGKNHQQQPLPCPCGSGRVCGSCGCVDDSYEKWYLDRVGSRWISGDISRAMSEAQSSVLSLCLPNFIFGTYYQQNQQQQQDQDKDRTANPTATATKK